MDVPQDHLYVPDHYETLGLTREASAADINREWRKLILLHHPDKGAHDAELFRLRELPS